MLVNKMYLDFIKTHFVYFKRGISTNSATQLGKLSINELKMKCPIVQIA